MLEGRLSAKTEGIFIHRNPIDREDKYCQNQVYP